MLYRSCPRPGGTDRRVATSGQGRSRDEILRLFDGFSLVAPGLVWVPQRRPGSAADIPQDPESYWALVGVGCLGGAVR